MNGADARPGAHARSLEGMDAGIGGRTARVIAVLALALGVLAMHVLAGGHHGAAADLPTSMTDAGTAHAAETGRALEHGGHELLAAAATAAAAPLNVARDVCDGDCSEHPAALLLLCVAILIAAGRALALTLQSRAWGHAPKTGPPTRVRPGTTAPPRRVDLVADLCISRT